MNSVNPNQPNGYPSYHSCSWLITVKGSFVVSLNLTWIYIPNCADNILKIYDGTSEASPKIKEYCEHKTPIERDELTSTGNSIYVVLKSGNLSKIVNHSNYFGFKARYGPTGNCSDYPVINICTFFPNNQPQYGQCSAEPPKSD